MITCPRAGSNENRPPPRITRAQCSGTMLIRAGVRHCHPIALPALVLPVKMPGMRDEGKKLILDPERHDDEPHPVLRVSGDRWRHSQHRAARKSRASTPEFDRLVREHLQAGYSKIIIDCRYLGFVSSLGIGSLVALQTRLHRLGGAVKLAAIQGPVMKVLRAVRLDKMLDIYGDLEFARMSFHERRE